MDDIHQFPIGLGVTIAFRYTPTGSVEILLVVGEYVFSYIHVSPQTDDPSKRDVDIFYVKRPIPAGDLREVFDRLRYRLFELKMNQSGGGQP